MQKNNLELKVGLFVVVGLVIICTLVIIFGRVGEQFRSSYTLDITFPNASGLLNGSYVYLSGAPIGRVTTPPKVVDNGNSVQVTVKIFDDLKISKKSRWVIGSAGLLGDRFIDVQLQSGNNPPYYDGSESVRGGRNPGINDITENVEPLIVDAKDAVRELKKALSAFNTDVMTEDTRIDVKESIVRAKSLIIRLDDLMAQAQKGQGTIGLLLNNKQVADNVAAFLYNIRKNGVLFYSDTYNKDVEDKDAQNKSTRDKRK
jgi:phospholipid/cholesterol/gamma-HCH transport system substrate-binding protein